MIKKINISIFVILILSFSSIIYGTSANITVNKNNITIGETVTINVSVVDAASMEFIVSGSTFTTKKDVWVDNAGQNASKVVATYNFTPKTVGNHVISLAAKAVETTNFAGFNVSKSVTITVKDKPVAPKPEPEPKPEPTPKPQAPNNNTKPVAKSADNYLKYLNVNMEGLSPNFSKYINNYTLTVGNNIDKLNLNYGTAHSKAKVAVTGNGNFNIGNNTVKVTVTAENGYSRTYNILVTKADDPTKADAFLENLVVENITLEEGFQTEKLEYNLGELSMDKLNILAYPRAEGAKVEITGADNLSDGENVIIIKVTALDNITTKEYKLILNNTVNKQENEVIVYDNLIDTENSDKNNNNELSTWFKKNGLYLLLLLAMFLEFIQILYMYNRLNKKRLVEEVFSDEDLTFNDLKPTGDVLDKINKEKEEFSNILKENENTDSESTEEEKLETLESILKKRRNNN